MSTAHDGCCQARRRLLDINYVLLNGASLEAHRDVALRLLHPASGLARRWYSDCRPEKEKLQSLAARLRSEYARRVAARTKARAKSWRVALDLAKSKECKVDEEARVDWLLRRGESAGVGAAARLSVHAPKARASRRDWRRWADVTTRNDLARWRVFCGVWHEWRMCM